MDSKNFIAFDLGATSGRTILGTVSTEGLTMKELTRFPNSMVALRGHFYWDIYALYNNLCEGLAAAAAEGVEITSAGIDTWGVDVAFFGSDGNLLGAPLAYRDPHTVTAHEEYFAAVMPRREVYARTGIQVMNFNTLYQLYAMRRDGSAQLAAARHAMFMPDALAYMLTGCMTTEYTIASTSQMLDARTKRIDTRLAESVGVSPTLFPPIVMPCHKTGLLDADIAGRAGCRRIPIISVAGHDTACAVAAVPAANERFAYLSSGTWSLMGIELAEPLITPRTEELNITNEGGVEGTTRLLKNITGMWIVERCLGEWRREGVDYDYPAMVSMAENAPAFRTFIDPDDALFANPCDMNAAIAEYHRRTSQPQPENHAQTIRCIFESLALKYRHVLGLFAELAPFPIETLHVIGGGSRNALLNSFTASATGLKVVAGPAEATAIGNIMLQAKAAGMVSSLGHMRRMIAQTVATEVFMPSHREAWDEAYGRFVIITKI